MRIQSLQTRFILAGCLLATFTGGCGLWNIGTLRRLSRDVDQSLRNSQATIDQTDALINSLEREDDALLLALSGARNEAKDKLDSERRRGDDHYRQLRNQLVKAKSQAGSAITRLEETLASYRRAGSSLIEANDSAGALQRYHAAVNPLLRHAVHECGEIREQNFVAMRLAGVRARDEAKAALGVVVITYLAALVVTAGVTAWLARSVVRPILELSASLDAVRRGEFEHRVNVHSHDEVGQLALDFNRMATTLEEYRKSSLGELLTAKRTLESTLNALPNAVFVIAPDASFAALNPPARAILAAKSVATAERVGDLPLDPNHRQAVDQALAGKAVLPSSADFTNLIQAKLEGRTRKFSLTAVAIPGFAPRQTGAVVVLNDVTEFALLDEVRAELIAIASHELKTPLTTLRMNLMLLAEASDKLSARQCEMVNAALFGCEELGSTIDELLDVTRIESGQLRLNLCQLDLSNLLDSAARSFRTRFEDAQVELNVRIGSGPAIIRGDAARLRSVITNLLSNALKYSPGGGEVDIEIRRLMEGLPTKQPYFEISVRDNGPGVPSPFQERIFEKFFRVEDHRERASHGVRGTGIGLYLCREIIKAHGGSIWCESTVGTSGTIVTFRLRADA